MDSIIDGLFKSGHIWGAVALCCFWYICRWFGPRIDKLLDRHTAFLDSTSAQVQQQTSIAGVTSACLERLEENQQKHMEMCRPHPHGPVPIPG